MSDARVATSALHDNAQGRTSPGIRTAERRAAIIRWVRKTHGWIGLWGAILGLLFGISGIALNHRAMLKFPGAETRETSWQGFRNPRRRAVRRWAIG
jgi:hypothetical protein